jgi:hypothetical protein
MYINFDLEVLISEMKSPSVKYGKLGDTIGQRWSSKMKGNEINE